jgi:Domain of unknown function (DUF4157)
MSLAAAETAKPKAQASNAIAAPPKAQEVEPGSAEIAGVPRYLAIQPKLTVGAPDDPLEREADHVADHVMRMPEPRSGGVPVTARAAASIRRRCAACSGPIEVPEDRISGTIQRKCAACAAAEEHGTHSDCECDDQERVQRRMEAAASGHASNGHGQDGSRPLGRNASGRIRALQGGGAPLSRSVRDYFEPRFGYDFSAVRIHTGGSAAESAHELGAQAYTLGQDIVFGAGRFSPDTPAGEHLLAHELAHTVQADGATLRRQIDPATSAIESPAETDAPATEAVPVEIKLLDGAPWLYEVNAESTPAAISLALYGIDLSPTPGFDQAAGGLIGVFSRGRYREIAYPELLVSPYRERFHQGMRTKLDSDVERVESILLETYISGSQEGQLIDLVANWERWRDLRTESNERTYFDAFLARLREDRLYTDYGLWESSSRSYFDELYGAVEERAGELNAMIAQHSREFGGYRPIWAELERRAGGEALPAGPNEELIERSSNLVLDALEGYTSGDDSTLIADTLSGLPPREQAAVLHRIMSHYDESDWTGIFGRFGEAWEGGMLYFLFEDLDESDQQRVGRALVDGGVMDEGTVAQLIAGRGWGGKYLPFTTYYGAQAAQFWADVAVENEGTAAGYLAYVPGMFASLWTPETAGSTALTLVTAGAAPGVAQAFPTVGRGLLVVGTGVTAYGTTIAIQELATGRDAYSGEELNSTDKIVRVLNVISGTLLLTAGFMQAAALSPRGSTGTGRLAPRLELPAGEGPVGEGPNVRFRVIRVDGDEYTVIGQHSESGETALLRINARTGEGTVTHLSSGQVVPIRGWTLQEPFAPLSAGGSGGVCATGAGSEIVPLGATRAIATLEPPPSSQLPATRPPPTVLTEPEYGVPELFESMQCMVPESVLGAEAVEAGLSEGIVPDLYYVDPVSGDYLPFYYSAESGRFQPYWNQAMQMGNVFNELGNWGYPVHELTLRTAIPSGRGSTVRLDSYDPVNGEIVSRKYTQLGGIDEFDALGYVQELVIKYPSGAQIATTPATRAAGLAGNTVTGNLVLEVAVQRYPIPERVLEYANSRNVTIRDATGHVYNP